jgi:hypothetical protein
MACFTKATAGFPARTWRRRGGNPYSAFRRVDARPFRRCCARRAARVIWGLIPAADCDVVCGAGVLDLGLPAALVQVPDFGVSGFGSTKPAIYGPTALF